MHAFVQESVSIQMAAITNENVYSTQAMEALLFFRVDTELVAGAEQALDDSSNLLPLHVSCRRHFWSCHVKHNLLPWVWYLCSDINDDLNSVMTWHSVFVPCTVEFKQWVVRAWLTFAFHPRGAKYRLSCAQPSAQLLQLRSSNTKGADVALSGNRSKFCHTHDKLSAFVNRDDAVNKTSWCTHTGKNAMFFLLLGIRIILTALR